MDKNVSNIFDAFIGQKYNVLADWLNTLNPYEYALIGVITAFLIAPSLNANQQNSIGNFLEEIGQILLTIGAQTITVEQANQYNSNYKRDIDILKREIMNLKEELKKK